MLTLGRSPGCCLLHQVGVLAASGQKGTSKEYFLAGRSQPGWLIAVAHRDRYPAPRGPCLPKAKTRSRARSLPKK